MDTPCALSWVCVACVFGVLIGLLVVDVVCWILVLVLLWVLVLFVVGVCGFCLRCTGCFAFGLG